ncbi:unnamed protein product [Echinostoma caproni]|uniref:ZZ-type domain-containing protein n=1 Tax=Echinostoma caproni TaxID=27848 RepID=A0A183AP26_9TREM|nr:unnamed protein product [Echinostoma caproni]
MPYLFTLLRATLFTIGQLPVVANNRSIIYPHTQTSFYSSLNFVIIMVLLTVVIVVPFLFTVRHNVRCEVCKREPIWGLRYKCTRCPHYNLCQDCFWTGVTTDQHTNAHDVKEYSSSSVSLVLFVFC